ncbi:MAG: hypothetical protein GY839_14335 [candidate division Zixibacteria bacterium]|nr:hypothetical protein [candidate division Zixibacteria bacterium]
MTQKLNNESGIVLLVCLSILFMLSLIGIASMSTSNNDMQIAENESRATGAFYAAEAGLEKAAASIVTHYQASGTPPDPLPIGTESELHYTYGYATIDNGPAVNKTLNAGSYKGLYGSVKSFTINSLGVDNSSASGVELEMQISDALIPLFQFAVFYENDLEIGPGPNMTLGGRVHTNSDMYLVTGSDLYIDSYMTAAGDIFHGIGTVVNNNDIWIKDDNGNYQSMRNADNTFLDSNDPNWVTESMNRWGGCVEDGNHGITELRMEVVSDGDATNIIDRYDNGNNPSSYENDAGLKVIDGQAYFKSGNNWMNVTGNMIAGGILTSGTFYDAREGQTVNSIDIDIDKLNSSAYFPSNGIVYCSTVDNGASVAAVRLKNGQKLADGLTVATDNPLYTLGDYNTVNKKPAALIADAVTILSNNWDDANSGLGLGSRTASPTQMNASYMTGNTLTIPDGHGYNGGLENLPRFLENWSGKDFTWRGSAVDLWYSRQANSDWGGGYYNAPNRDWAFDPDLLDIDKLPPGTPLVNIVQRMNWSQKIAHWIPDESGNGNGNGNN